MLLQPLGHLSKAPFADAILGSSSVGSNIRKPPTINGSTVPEPIPVSAVMIVSLRLCNRKPPKVSGGLHAKLYFRVFLDPIYLLARASAKAVARMIWCENPRIVLFD